MRVDKGEMIMKATTYKDLKKWIDEGVDLAELAQGYADKVPNADREQFEAITQEIFNVLEGVSLMLDDKVLIYNRKAEQKRLNDIEQGNGDLLEFISLTVLKFMMKILLKVS